MEPVNISIVKLYDNLPRFAVDNKTALLESVLKTVMDPPGGLKGDIRASFMGNYINYKNIYGQILSNNDHCPLFLSSE